MNKFKIEKSFCGNRKTFITFDIGTSLLKCIYLDKENDDYNTNSANTDIIFTNHLTTLTIEIDDFLINIKLRISNFECFKSNLILISGLQCKHFQYKIGEIFNCEVKIISEMEAMASGLRYIIRNSDKENYFCSDGIIDSKHGTVSDVFLEKILKKWKDKQESGFKNPENKDYPCLYISAGSVARYIVIDETGQGKEVSLNSFAGHTFLGLAKCLINSNDIDELIAIGEVGNRENIDSQIKDILDGIEKSPYGIFPAELPIFAFGKAMDLNSNEKLSFRNEDISQSLTSMILENAMFIATQIASTTHCKKIFIGGNLFRNKVFRVEYSKFCVIMPEIIKTYFLKDGLETNIGLLVWKENEFPIVN